MSPAMNRKMTPGASEWSAQTSENPDRLVLQRLPEEAPEDAEHNPWRNHEDDGHKWLGLLLATVGAGAIGYLVAGI